MLTRLSTHFPIGNVHGSISLFVIITVHYSVAFKRIVGSLLFLPGLQHSLKIKIIKKMNSSKTILQLSTRLRMFHRESETNVRMKTLPWERGNKVCPKKKKKQKKKDIIYRVAEKPRTIESY